MDRTLSLCVPGFIARRVLDHVEAPRAAREALRAQQEARVRRAELGLLDVLREVAGAEARVALAAPDRDEREAGAGICLSAAVSWVRKGDRGRARPRRGRPGRPGRRTSWRPG